MPLINPGPLEWDTTIKWDPTSPTATGWVEIPYDLNETFGKGNMVPVVATFDGHVTYRGSIAKMPFACLILRKDVRAALGKEGGDPVHVRIELDESPRSVELPPDLATALDDAALAGTFTALAYSHQRAYVDWIEGAKRADTRDRRVARAIEMLREGRRSPR